MKSLLSTACCLVLLADWVSPAPAHLDARPDTASEALVCATEGGQDCNSNGVEDAVDIASGYSIDLDGNGVPDECDARRR